MIPLPISTWSRGSTNHNSWTCRCTTAANGGRWPSCCCLIGRNTHQQHSHTLSRSRGICIAHIWAVSSYTHNKSVHSTATALALQELFCPSTVTSNVLCNQSRLTARSGGGREHWYPRTSSCTYGMVSGMISGIFTLGIGSRILVTWETGAVNIPND